MRGVYPELMVVPNGSKSAEHIAPLDVVCRAPPAVRGAQRGQEALILAGRELAELVPKDDGFALAPVPAGSESAARTSSHRGFFPAIITNVLSGQELITVNEVLDSQVMSVPTFDMQDATRRARQSFMLATSALGRHVSAWRM